MTNMRSRTYVPILCAFLAAGFLSGCTGPKRYQIIDREITDPKQVRLRVTVPYGTSSDDIIGILQKIVKEYKQYGDWMEIWIWETEITEEMKEGVRRKMVREGQDLGVPVFPDYEPWLYENRSVYRVTWLYPGEWTIEEYTELLKLDSDAVPRFTEEDRMRIYREVLKAEEEVTTRAVSLYGRNLSIMLEANGAIEAKNRQRVLDKYGISHAEWSQILHEGIQKWW